MDLLKLSVCLIVLETVYGSYVFNPNAAVFDATCNAMITPRFSTTQMTKMAYIIQAWQGALEIVADANQRIQYTAGTLAGLNGNIPSDEQENDLDRYDPA